MADEPLSDPRDYVLDLSSQALPSSAPQHGSPTDAPTPRPYLSILFKCCNVYAAIYKTGDGKAYAGHCPRCARPARVAIGPGGSTNRVFIAQ